MLFKSRANFSIGIYNEVYTGFNFVSEYITFIDYKSSYVEKVTININKLQG